MRSAVISLFEGEGRGMRSRAANHTAWGFVNAVVELEDHRRGSPVGSMQFRRRRDAESALFGSRAAAKERAMTEALRMIQN